MKKCKVCGDKILHVNPYCTKCQNGDIENFGAYRMGLTSDEIKEYLCRRFNKLSIENIYKRFNKAAGCNTCAVGPQGQTLMYRWDVKRFYLLIAKGTPTYWD